MKQDGHTWQKLCMAHEVTAETKENRTIYTQVFEIDNGIEKRCINHWHTLCNLPASEHAVYICGWQDITEKRDLMQLSQKVSFWQQ